MSQLKNKFFFELIWLAFTAVCIVLLMLPIYSTVGLAYPFYKENIIVIIVAITFIRYIFLLKHHWVSLAKWIKIAFIFIPIPFVFLLIGIMDDFQAYCDEIGLEKFLDVLPYKQQATISKYIKTEMLLFWTGAFLANAYMPIRMILSLWREINKGTH